MITKFYIFINESSSDEYLIPNSWMSPEGKIYKVSNGPQYHIKKLKNIFKDNNITEFDVYELGWIKIGCLKSTNFINRSHYNYTIYLTAKYSKSLKTALLKYDYIIKNSLKDDYLDKLTIDLYYNDDTNIKIIDDDTWQYKNFSLPSDIRIFNQFLNNN